MVGVAASSRHVLVSFPMCSISTSMTSPSWRKTGGLRNAPTPRGVPVAITSPGMSVNDADRRAISSATEKISVLGSMPVAMATRTGAGPVLQDTYGFPGSERDLHRLGLLDAGDLTPLKARVLLTAAIWSQPSREKQEAVFLDHARALE